MSLPMFGWHALVIALFAFSGTPAAAAVPQSGEIRPAGAATAIPDSFLVMLKDSAAARRDGVDATVRGLTGRYGGRVGHTFRHAMRGFELEVGEAAARRLAANPAVDFVQRNGIHTLTGGQWPTPSWGLDRVDQRYGRDDTYLYPTVAAGVRAYIVDTGIR